MTPVLTELFLYIPYRNEYLGFISFFNRGPTPLFICVKSELDFAAITAAGSPEGSVLQPSSNPFKALNENGVKKFAWLPGSANPVIHHQQQQQRGGGWVGG